MGFSFWQWDRTFLQFFNNGMGPCSSFFNQSRESDLIGYGITMRIGKIPIQTPLGVLLGFQTQPCYEASDERQVK